MAKKIRDGLYECSFCFKRYTSIAMAVGCEQGHNIIYVPLPKEDLMALIQFIYTGEAKLLEKHPNIMKILGKYSRVKPTEDDVSSMQE